MKAAFSIGLMLLLAGCSSGTGAGAGGGAGGGAAFDAGKPDGGGAGGGQDAGLPVKTACTVLNARRCEYFKRCGLISEAGMRDCLANLQATSCGPSKWQARVESPVSTLRYDGQVAQQCADAWGARACNDYGLEPTTCGRFLLPNAFPTQACYDGYSECTEPSVNVCRGTACPRSCQTKGAPGEVCRDTADCLSTLYCKLNTIATGSGLCTAYGQADAGCDLDTPCSPFSDPLLCFNGKCVQPPIAGQGCLGSACDQTAWCQSGVDGGLCKLRLASQAACTDDVQCQTPLLCEVLTGKCVSRQLTTIGTVCGLRQTCPPGSVCLGATSTSLGECQPPLDAGASCASSNDCQAHLACVGLDGGLALGCGPRQGDGMRCSENRDCQLLSICKQTTCVRLPTTGDSCAVAGTCLFGPCVTSDAGTICTEPFGPGIVCTRNADCGSGRCVTGKCLPSCTP